MSRTFRRALALVFVALLLAASAGAVSAAEGHAEVAGPMAAEAMAHTHAVDETTEGLIDGLMSGGFAFLYITLAAMLPLLWVLALILHLSRPYLVRTIRKFTLRFGADVWWLLYVMIRDAVMILTFAISVFFFFPDRVAGLPLPVTAPLATIFLFWALLIKLTRDADDDAGAYRKVTYLLLVGATTYLVPFLFGVEASMEGWEAARSAMSSSQNPALSMPILYLSLVLLGATGAYIFYFVARGVARASGRGGTTSRLAGRRERALRHHEAPTAGPGEAG
ncbi:hypothetical protein [Limnochorda pilosa]|nr:hypothetical protein [Limnochorda pilosa]